MRPVKWRRAELAGRRAAWASALILPLVATVATAALPAREQDRLAILRTIAGMERAWNHGDFRGYMAGFRNPDVVFISGGEFQSGWQGTLDHYVRDYGTSPETRGILRFSDIRIEFLASDAAMLIGRYHLERPRHAIDGVNTRLFRKIGGRWLITMNHVSAHDVASRPGKPISPPSASADR